jgi:hypothetical protein
MLTIVFEGKFILYQNEIHLLTYVINTITVGEGVRD